jgi:hypothetical protein
MDSRALNLEAEIGMRDWLGFDQLLEISLPLDGLREGLSNQ